MNFNVENSQSSLIVGQTDFVPRDKCCTSIFHTILPPEAVFQRFVDLLNNALGQFKGAHEEYWKVCKDILDQGKLVSI